MGRRGDKKMTATGPACDARRFLNNGIETDAVSAAHGKS
jgi:hypothetical protein